MKLARVACYGMIAASVMMSAFILPLVGEEKITFAIIFAGGPDVGSEGKNIVAQFLKTVSETTKMKQDAMEGDYFNTSKEAMEYIQKHKNTYIMGSLGFYLSQRKTNNLVPLAVVKLKGNDQEQFYVLVKKGTYSSLKDLKGKILSGNVLYEDTRFLDSIVFDNTLSVAKHFKLEPTARPLSAIRKMGTGKVDAILLNHLQYETLKSHPSFKDLKIIHRSAKMPALGLMMVGTKRNKEMQPKIVKAITTMCETEKGKPVCKNFGIDGFQTIDAKALENEIKKYEGAE